MAGRITYMTWSSFREQIGSLNEFVTPLPSLPVSGLGENIKIHRWCREGEKRSSSSQFWSFPSEHWSSLKFSNNKSWEENMVLFKWKVCFSHCFGCERHETALRSLIKVGLTSHPGIKRIKPRVHYTLPPTHQNTVGPQLLHWCTVAPLYWFFKWGLIGSDPPDPSTKYLRFKISIRGR